MSIVAQLSQRDSLSKLVPRDEMIGPRGEFARINWRQEDFSNHEL